MSRVLHLVSAPFPEYHGTITRLIGLLSRIPHEIVLIIPDKINYGSIIESKEDCFGNIKIKNAPTFPLGIFSKPPVRYIHSIYRVPKILFQTAISEKFDIIHAHDSSRFLHPAEKSSTKLNKPLIIEFHAIRNDYISNMNIPGIGIEIPYSGRIYGMLYEERRIKSALNSCNHVITLTEPLKHWISNYYKIEEDNITVVSNGVDIDRFSPKYEENVEKIKETLHLKDKVIMYSGVLNQINGIADLINFIPSMIAEKPENSFLFIGHGPLESKIIDLSKRYPQVKHLPNVPHEQMPTYYQMCDLFVIPRPSTISTETITPLKLLEVMAMEKPVLGSDVGGIADVIRHEENGYLFKKGNTDSLKRALLEILGSDNNQIGRNARKTVVKNYT